MNTPTYDSLVERIAGCANRTFKPATINLLLGVMRKHTDAENIAAVNKLCNKGKIGLNVVSELQKEYSSWNSQKTPNGYNTWRRITKSELDYYNRHCDVHLLVMAHSDIIAQWSKSVSGDKIFTLKISPQHGLLNGWSYLVDIFYHDHICPKIDCRQPDPNDDNSLITRVPEMTTGILQQAQDRLNFYESAIRQFLLKNYEEITMIAA